MDVDNFPTIILLRRISDPRDEEALRRAVRRAVGEDAAATVAFVGSNAHGMTYYQWRLGDTTCHIGECSRPYRDVGGVGDLAVGRLIEWHDGDAGEPDDPALRAAWRAHRAWTYVDALDSCPDSMPPLLRLAGELVDDDTLLIWRYQGCRPIRGPMVLPSANAKAALAAGQWPKSD